jgi:hypothetical protein
MTQSGRLQTLKEAGEVLDDLFRHLLLDVVATLDGLVRDDMPDAAADDATVVAEMKAICDEFETYGYRRVGAELRHRCAF